jgi:ABC-2 type transport system ATP-binding protein
MSGSSAAVAAENLVKIYPGGVHAVDGISFTAASGEAFGLLGPNGAGKTTTIGMLNSTVRPTSGVATLGGRDVARDPIGTRALSSVVFQDAVVDLPLTGRHNLELHMRLWGIAAAAGRAWLRELAEIVGIDDILDRPMATYSGGQRRRLEIIRALLSRPEVLFLDEPTVGLDPRIRHDLFDVIATLREQTGVTIIMTTHYLDEAERLCDRLAIIDSGRVVALDTPASLLASIGREVLELRVDDAKAAADALASHGVGPDDVVVIGQTVTASLRVLSGAEALRLLQEESVIIRSATTRPATLDDVYLRLTGGRIDAANIGEDLS